MIPTRRFHVFDEVGLLRSFYTKAEALHFIGNDATMTLKIDPRHKKPRVDWSNFEPAPF